MYKQIKWMCVFILIFGCIFSLHADSPITSTHFHKAYKDIPMVVKAAQSDGILTKEMAAFLSSNKNPIDQKAALINALSWDIDGKDNSSLYFEFLAQKYYGSKIDSFTLEPFTGDEIFCLAYLRAMDDYFNVLAALDIFDIAWMANDTSFTVSMIYAIVEAQDAMDYDWCEVWLLIEDVLLDDMLVMDMRKESVTIILDYLQPYEKHCEEYDDY
jgi:hypothetical protein